MLYLQIALIFYQIGLFVFQTTDEASIAHVSRIWLLFILAISQMLIFNEYSKTKLKTSIASANQFSGNLTGISLQSARSRGRTNKKDQHEIHLMSDGNISQINAIFLFTESNPFLYVSLAIEHQHVT